MADIGFFGKLSTARRPPRPGTFEFKAFQALTRLNVWMYRRTGGRGGGRFDRMPLCILHPRGAKTGQPRETPLTYLPDGERVVVIASYGGAPKSPSCFHNVKANPDIEVERDGRREPMTAHVASASERAELWPRIVEMNPGYDVYQQRTEREIPVIICAPRSP